MVLITIPECEACSEIKKIIRDKKIDIEIEEIKKRNGKYTYNNIDLPSQSGFPILFFGLDNNSKPNYLIGKEGIASYLNKGYVYSPEGNFCPYLKKKCIEKKCARFGILFKGMVPEGGCSDYWNPILITEAISRMSN